MACLSHLFHRGACLLAAAMWTSSACAQAQLPQNAAEWRQAALTDIEAGYQITLDNHPGVHDPANPDFLKNLTLARDHGRTLAATVSDSAGYAAAVMGFNTRIGDGHAGMETTIPTAARYALRWPGFATVWRGQSLLVRTAEAGAPPVGAQVVSCDGKAINDYIAENVFAFRGRKREAGHWWVFAPSFFVDFGNPFVTLPKHCQFSVDGKQFGHTLTWKAGNAQFDKWRSAGDNGDKLAVGMTEPAPGLFWVAMPSFQPDEKERAAYRAINQQIESQRRQYLNAKAIVVDLRHNMGGSSTWSMDFAQALWGKERVQRRNDAYTAKSETWWRASPGNGAYVAGLIERYLKEGELEDAQWAKMKSAGIQAALSRKDVFFIDKKATLAPATSDANADLPGDPPAFTKPLYVIVPGQCFSACLDAIDIFTRFPNTILVGAPSAADSTYMEVREEKLPSALAKVLIPVKVDVNRPRANGQFYTPAIYATDAEWSSANFLKLIQKDLLAK